jgi:hypothetical protein
LTIARRLAAADPGNAQAARDVSVSLNNVGQVAVAAGRLGDADTAYTEMLDIARRLAAADPGNAEAARDVMVSLVRLAELAERQYGEGSAQAQQGWRDVVDVLDQMDARGWITPADRGFAAQFRAKAAGGGHRRAGGTSPSPVGFTGADRVGNPEAAASQFTAETAQAGSDTPLALDDAFLADVGLADLPADQRAELVAHIIDTLQERVGTRLAAGLTDAQLAEFERLMESGDQAAALTWLETNAPDYQTVTRSTLDELKTELRTNAHQILAAAQVPPSPSRFRRLFSRLPHRRNRRR